MFTNPKKKFFKNKLQTVQFAIYDLEFKVAKSRQVREDIRGDRERTVQAIQAIKNKLQEKLEKDVKKQYEAELKTLEDNAQRYEAQMRMIDEQINGIPANKDNPGQDGIMDTIKAHVELREMIKDYIKTL